MDKNDKQYTKLDVFIMNIQAVIITTIIIMATYNLTHRDKITIPLPNREEWFCTKGTDVEHCEQWSKIDRD